MTRADGPNFLRAPVRDRRGTANTVLATVVCLLLGVAPGTAAAHSWFSDYTTGQEEFESCCGDEDCRTARSLGNPKIIRRDDGGYDVKVGVHWIKYDFPAVHTSHDANVWICYLEGYTGPPDPLCLFLPPGIM